MKKTESKTKREQKTGKKMNKNKTENVAGKVIKTRTLANGVRIITEKMPHVRSIALGIMVRTGAVDENEKNAGISHFVEHMMFKGTEKRGPYDIAGDIDKIGGQINAFTAKEIGRVPRLQRSPQPRRRPPRTTRYRRGPHHPR